MLKVTTFRKLTSPALFLRTSSLYTPMGLEPVGRPSTKGRSSLWALIFATM